MPDAGPEAAGFFRKLGIQPNGQVPADPTRPQYLPRVEPVCKKIMTELSTDFVDNISEILRTAASPISHPHFLNVIEPSSAFPERRFFKFPVSADDPVLPSAPLQD
ncbi:hypothetical protein [Methylosarcina fibrata]|uniref:hypothetical protein n=1 Tax=Methylosarcina fibrata TaxID=105972 RepID=UPI0003603124|nr:hypothetical protein [Methylosarcina fibrata]